MTNEKAIEKANKIMQLIYKHTYPKEQFGFFTEQDFFDLIFNILIDDTIE